MDVSDRDVDRQGGASAIVAEPNLRAILGMLLGSERSVGDIERRLGLSQPSVSQVEARAACGVGRLARAIPALLVKAR